MLRLGENITESCWIKGKRVLIFQFNSIPDFKMVVVVVDFIFLRCRASSKSQYRTSTATKSSFSAKFNATRQKMKSLHHPYCFVKTLTLSPPRAT